MISVVEGRGREYQDYWLLTSDSDEMRRARHALILATLGTVSMGFTLDPNEETAVFLQALSEKKKSSLHIPLEADSCLPKVLATEDSLSQAEIVVIQAATAGNVSLKELQRRLRQIDSARDVFDTIRHGLLTHEGYRARATDRGLFEAIISPLERARFWSPADRELQLAAEQQGATHFAYRVDVAWEDGKPRIDPTTQGGVIGRLGTDGAFEPLMTLPVSEG